MKSFSKKSIETLKHYVYALVDPESNQIFYIGRGKGNRGLQHLKESNSDESEKKKTIAGIPHEIKNQGWTLLDMV